MIQESNFKIIKSVHLVDEYASSITAMHHREHNTTKGTYMYYDVVDMNYDPKHHFFILGLLDDKVIAKCSVHTYYDFIDNEVIYEYDKYLITSLIVDKDYQRRGYGTRFIDAVITILKEENASVIAAFTCPNSRRLFEKFNFIKDESVKSFGDNWPGDETDIYYELKVKSNFYLTTKVDYLDAKFVGRLMVNELIKYDSKIPKCLLPDEIMYANHLITLNKLENERCRIIRCGKLAVGYVYMNYEDYDTLYGSDHSIYLNFFIGEAYLYKSVLELLVSETINFYNTFKEDNNINSIKVYLNESSIIPSRYSLYKRWLTGLGFVEDKERLFIKNM